MNMRILVTFCVLCLMLPPVAWTDDAELAGVYYESGLAALKQSNYQEAITKFTKALEYRPEFPQALFKTGECYEKIKDNAMALAYYRRCIRCLRVQPNLSRDDQSLLSNATRCLDRMDINTKQFIRIKNTQVTGLLSMATECVNKKRYRIADRILNLVLVIDPNNKSALELLGKMDDSNANAGISPANLKAYREHLAQAEAYAAKAEWDKVIDECTEAIKLNPKSDKAYCKRANAYYGKRDWDKVIEDLKQAVKLNPKNDEALTTIGHAYYRKRDYAGAIPAYDQAIKVNPKNAGALAYRGTAYSQLKDDDRALADLNAAIKISPGNSWARLNRGFIYVVQRKHDLAIIDLGEAIKSREYIAYYGRAICYYNSGNIKSAIADGEALIKNSPNSQEAQKMQELLIDWRNKNR